MDVYCTNTRHCIGSPILHWIRYLSITLPKAKQSQGLSGFAHATTYVKETRSVALFREALQKTGVNIKPILLRLKDR